MSKTLAGLGAGLALAALSTASPLTLVVAMLAALLLRYAGRGLADSERRLLFSMLAVALAVRAAAIVVLFLLGIPSLNDMSVGALSGDEAYNLSRALRARDVLRGLGDTRYDRFRSEERRVGKECRL